MALPNKSWQKPTQIQPPNRMKSITTSPNNLNSTQNNLNNNNSIQVPPQYVSPYMSPFYSNMFGLPFNGLGGFGDSFLSFLM